MAQLEQKVAKLVTTAFHCSIVRLVLTSQPPPTTPLHNSTTCNSMNPLEIPKNGAECGGQQTNF